MGVEVVDSFNYLGTFI